MTASRTALLEGARRGEQAAWDDLVSDFSSLVWSIARGYRLPDEDAADAVQMTWLRLVENLDRIRDAERLPGWLATTARRECLQVLRRSGREIPTFDDSPQLSVDPAPPVDTALLLDERDRAVWSAFSVLGERCRRLLRVLMASPPPSYREVSDALAMPVGSIGPTRQRCLEDLRRIVQTDAALTAQLGDEPR
jgi:RNA polymerase sigma factor (sigma-70 family)